MFDYSAEFGLHEKELLKDGRIDTNQSTRPASNQAAIVISGPEGGILSAH
jgi:hypothetical protein